MHDAMRNTMDAYAAEMAAYTSTSCLEANTLKPLSVREIMLNNSAAMRDIIDKADCLLTSLRGPVTQECSGKEKTDVPDSMISEVRYQEQILDEINGKLIAALNLLNG